MSRITSEFLGTFLLCCFVLLGGRFGFALGLAALAWCLGSTVPPSFNPLASLALLLRRRLGWAAALGDSLTHLGAALAAALFTGLMAGHNAERLSQDAGVVPEAWLGALFAEGAATFGCLLVFLVAFTSRRAAGNALAPFVLGAAVFALHETFARPTAFMNPALAVAWGAHDLFSAVRADEPGAALLGELGRFARFVPWAGVLILVQLAATAAAWGAFLLAFPEERSD